jgi:hypothetical protein
VNLAGFTGDSDLRVFAGRTLVAVRAFRDEPSVAAGQVSGHHQILVIHAPRARTVLSGVANARPLQSLPELELSRAAQKAVALAQQEKSTWTRADLIKYLGRVLPRSGLDPSAAAALLEDLADRALRSEFEPVLCLEAPEAVEVPRSLLRADGRSVYQRHGGVRYATRAQLAMEDRMLAQARADGAPRLTRADAARALGAGPGAARARAGRIRQDAGSIRAGTGLGIASDVLFRLRRYGAGE